MFKPLRGEQWEAGIKYDPAGSRLSLNAAAYHWKEKNQLVAVTPVLSVQLDSTQARGVELEARGQVVKGLDVIAQYNYIDLDEQLNGIPSQQTSVWAKYSFAVAGVTGLSVGAGVRHMNEFRDGNAPTMPDVTLVDAMFAWESTNWRIALNVNNLSNKDLCGHVPEPRRLLVWGEAQCGVVCHVSLVSIALASIHENGAKA